MMTQLRKLTDSEIGILERRGSSAEDWQRIRVAENFRPEQLMQCRLEGDVELGEDARILRSCVRNYRIGDRSTIEGVTLMECRHETQFGNGVRVATMNECGGRTVKIYDTMTAQAAYIMAIYRHRNTTISTLERMIDSHSRHRASAMGEVGRDCHISSARFIREVRIADRVTIEGASALENGTLCNDVRVGVDVKCYDFILAEGAQLDNGATIERCFVGENSRLDKGFTAADSLFFANSHCENGEAASIFAGPYTVSHHKSSLLIAGMFSFFNAGSGSNQSNHLFKSGAVHQAVHLRGCKFASSAYIMSPALEGAFTMVMGHHSYHHDTSAFPYSYLVEKEGRSVLMPGANLNSYGAVRDIEKWPLRDRRKVYRDTINFEEYNPYIAGAMIRALNTLHTLRDEDPNALTYSCNKVQIRAQALERGLKLYNRAVVAALGAMLSKGGLQPDRDGEGRWIDVAGQYMTRRHMESVLDSVDRNEVASLEALDRAMRDFSLHYDDYAHSWAYQTYEALIGHAPSATEISEIIEAGNNAHAAIRRTAENDRERDCSMDMAISYGLDGESDEQRADYYAVRGL